MRYVFLAVLFLVSVTGSRLSAQEPDDPPLYSEQGIVSTIKVEGRGHYHRLIIGGILWGTQINDKFVRHWADDIGFIIPGSPWDVLLAAGANASFDPRQEPLSYYHRTGPVGALFRELRTRKNGADATAPVAILGLAAGTEAAYALRGQKFIYYEADPALKRLTADSDTCFTFIRDARKRGAEIDVRIGNRREMLKEDKERKYALILVDQAETYPISKDVFTKEAVQLYFDRLTDDGIVALHVSNKYIYLEPMFAQLAKDLKLEARAWSDNNERGKPGKTASTWIVLAKSEKVLGTLALPEKRQREKYSTRFIPLESLPGIPVWTDAYAEVLVIAMVPGVQRIRAHFGLPTPVGELSGLTLPP